MTLKSTLALAALSAASLSHSQVLRLETPFTGFTRSITMNSHPGESRLFVVEQRFGTGASATGRIRIVQNGTLLTTPFLTLTGITTGSEQGLLGMDFHPDWPAVPQIFLHYTDTSGTSRIVRFNASTANPNVVDASSRVEILRIPQPFSNHNGGTLRFGPDRMLYIGMGDGGSGNDPQNLAQNVASLLGKFLRIDPFRDDFPTDSNRNYGIPAGNPFIGITGEDEIYTIGWRNPWQWSFDEKHLGGFGGIIVMDVGQSAFEEVSYMTPQNPARNYGWRVFEGFQNTGLGGGTGGPYETPLLAYGRSEGLSISGGVINRSLKLGPEYYGMVMWSDFGNSDLRGAKLTFASANSKPTVGPVQDLIDLGGSITAVNTDGAGNLYSVSNSGSVTPITSDAVPVSGRVLFNGLSATAPVPSMVTIQMRNGVGEVFNLQLAPQADGTYRVPAYPGSWTISVQQRPWLRRTVDVTVTASGASGVDLALIVGDIDGDNAITIFDYIDLSSSFDLSQGDAGFNAFADLDGDGSVTIFDYILLSGNFDSSGDSF